MDNLEVSAIPEYGHERHAMRSQVQGFHIRHPPAPHELVNEKTSDEELFQTIHMGAVDVDREKWLLVIDGLVQRPFALTYEQLQALPNSTVTSIHECFGSPLTAPTTALWRIGNVTWTGVPLVTLLAYAQPLASAEFVWSEGLDSGVFAGVYSDCYQKDLPMNKAMSPEVLVAYAMNGRPLGKERGGPVRLVVPGWFGTNSTKWLSKLSLQKQRAPGPYTTRFYNIKDPDNSRGGMVPVWKVDVNSIIVRPCPHSAAPGPGVLVEGWAWSHDGVTMVEVSVNGGKLFEKAKLKPRTDFSWQMFSLVLTLQPGLYTIIARATSRSGKTQPLTGYRNHVQSVQIRVIFREGKGAGDGVEKFTDRQEQ